MSYCLDRMSKGCWEAPSTTSAGKGLLAGVNLHEAQRKQKTETVSFNLGKKLSSFFLSQLTSCCAVTYEVHRPEKTKPKQTYHINLLKEWTNNSSPPLVKATLLRELRSEEDCDEDVTELTSSSMFSNIPSSGHTGTR